jgi:hypothetical protein
MVDAFSEGESKYGRVYKVAGPRKFLCQLLILQLSWRRICQDQKCTSWSRSAGTNWSEKSLSLKETQHRSSATRILLDSQLVTQFSEPAARFPWSSDLVSLA